MTADTDTAPTILETPPSLHYVPQEHVPVLAAELLALLDPPEGATAIDCTFGVGGHARLVADRLGPRGTLIAIDRDPACEDRHRQADLASATRFVRARFDEALHSLREEGVRAEAIYMDLGMSSLQLDAWERGFSYAFDAPLDMRMDPDQELSAAEVVNEWHEDEIARILARFGEERFSRRIAREIVSRRPLRTTGDLARAAEAGIPARARLGQGNPARRTFQAVRIAVNDELSALDRALPIAWSMLAEGGVLAAISFHSLEDRRVKRFLSERSRGPDLPPNFPVRPEPEAELLTPRVVRPSESEVARNPRARSARLRAARKLREGVS